MESHLWVEAHRPGEVWSHPAGPDDLVLPCGAIHEIEAEVAEDSPHGWSAARSAGATEVVFPLSQPPSEPLPVAMANCRRCTP